MRFFARTTAGLEWVLAAEVAGRGGRVEQIGHRTVEAVGPIESTALATADDVYLWVASMSEVGHVRTALQTVGECVRDVDSVEAIARLIELRAEGAASKSQPLSMEVVASFVGRRNYNRFDLEDVVGEAISESVGLRYISRRDKERVEADVSWRVHVDGDRLLLGLRVGDVPLHRRAYKQVAQPATLHPPLAAALCLLAGLRPGARLLDPCCGSGTIPIEARRLDPSVVAFGSDSSADAVAGAVRNSVGFGPGLAVADALAPPFRVRFDRIVTNPPWGEQTTWAEGDGLRRFLSSLPDLLAAGGRAVVLLGEEDEQAALAALPMLSVAAAVRVMGRFARVLVLPEPGGEVVDSGGVFGPQLADAWRSRRLPSTTNF